VRFVGHPLADSIAFEDSRVAARNQLGINDNVTVITLMPGSRSSEIKRLGTVFINTAKALQQLHPEIIFILPCANSEGRLQVQTLLKNEGCESLIKLIEGDAQTAISASNLVLLASGTATLEAMLLKRLMVICYKLAPLTWALASRMLKIPHVGLPNLLAGKLLVPEFLQDAVTEENLVGEITRLLNDEKGRQETILHFENIHKQIAGNANERAADAVLEFIRD
jgi:lipid-A-disaccharide synthase